ncbi:G-type lectin S-receptor-like serine/threonine-protein kinase, partial [Cucurbita argyrosperma subsp. sororia]
MSEAKLLGGVQHRNVVALLGYCVHGSEKLLVYEYVSNESLDKLLFSKPRILGPRHTKSHTKTAFSSDVGTSGVSYSSALTTNTVSATEIDSRASSVSRGHDTRGKRPVEG